MKIVCEHCHKDVDYHNGDRHQVTHPVGEIKIVDYYYIICPNCKEQIKI